MIKVTDQIKKVRSYNLSLSESRVCIKCSFLQPIGLFEKLYKKQGRNNDRIHVCQDCRRAGSREAHRKNCEEFNIKMTARGKRREEDSTICHYCERNLSNNDYGWKTLPSGKELRDRRCKLCRRLKKYNLSFAKYTQLVSLANQIGCFNCHGEHDIIIIRDTFILDHYVIDHDHVTGLVRGLLCTSCNMAVGQFKDDPESMRNAANYIERSRKSGFDPYESMLEHINKENSEHEKSQYNFDLEAMAAC